MSKVLEFFWVGDYVSPNSLENEIPVFEDIIDVELIW